VRGAGIGERHTPDLGAVPSGLCAAGESPAGERVVGGDDPDQHPQLLHHQDTQSQLRVVKAFSGNFVEKSAVG
jgi:hypothetical protein